MTGRLLIVGAGGFGRELLAMWTRTDWPDTRCCIRGFLDSNLAALAGFGCDYPIIGDPLTYQPAVEDLFLCAIGDPATKLRVCGSLRARGARFLNLIHPTALLYSDVEHCEGLIVCAFSTVSTNVTLGSFVTINSHCGIGHDASLGDGSTLSSYCNIAGAAVLGEGVFMGSHAVVLPKIRVGDYSTIGAASVAMWPVRPHSTVVGVPAKRIMCREGP